MKDQDPMDPVDPLSLPDVLQIVERRRRRRARARAVGAPAAGVAAAGIAGVIVVVLQTGAGPANAPAPHVPVLAPPSATAPPASTAPPRISPPLDGYADPDYLVGMADSLFEEPSEEDVGRLAGDAAALSAAWGVEPFPAAKAIVMKARSTGLQIDPRDPLGDDQLVDRFAALGFTEEDAAQLAAVWGTDTRTAEVMGAIIGG